MKFYYTPRRRTRYLAAIWKSCLLKKDNFSRDYFRDESWEEFLVILIIIRHLLLPYRLYNVIYRNFHIRKGKDRNPRNMANSKINHSRYPSLHMFLQFTFLGFKMLISNSAIKRARWSTGNEKKRNLYICIFEPRATRNTCCSRSGKSWSKLSLRQFSRRTMVHGVKLADRVFHTRPKGAHTHTHTRIQRD